VLASSVAAHAGVHAANSRSWSARPDGAAVVRHQRPRNEPGDTPRKGVKRGVARRDRSALAPMLTLDRNLDPARWSCVGFPLRRIVAGIAPNSRPGELLLTGYCTGRPVRIGAQGLSSTPPCAPRPMTALIAGNHKKWFYWKRRGQVQS